MEKFLLTTNPGLEDIVEREIRERGGKPISASKGRVIAGIRDPLSLRSVYHVSRLVGIFQARSLDDIYSIAKSLEIPELENAETFRVTSERHGNHDFTSLDIQRVAGRAFDERYPAKVKLKGADVEIVADLIGEELLIGVKITRESLHKRYPRQEHPASLKPVVAFCLLTLSRGKGMLYDPFCGGGTIPIEAAQAGIFGSAAGSDKSRKFVEMASSNSRSAGVEVPFFVADARHLPLESDSIVTNPPYGRRLRGRGFLNLYASFLNDARQMAGEVVIISQRIGDMEKAISISGWSVHHYRRIEMGGLKPGIWVLR